MALECARTVGKQQMWLSFVKSNNYVSLYLQILNEFFAYFQILNLWIFFLCCKMYERNRATVELFFLDVCFLLLAAANNSLDSALR